MNAQNNSWIGILQADSVNNITFNFKMDVSQSTLSIYNGSEEIVIEDLVITDDSVSFYFPVYQSLIKAKYFQNELSKKLGSTVWNMEGVWEKYPGTGKYDVPFKAYSVDEKNSLPANTPSNIEGKWAVKFSPDTDDEYPAIGEFKQDGNNISGTFLTETGDYRFLSGNIFGNTFYLSCFDGSHAFLFKGDVFGNVMAGQFLSGKHWSEPFSAKLDPEIELSNPYELTYLNEGYENFDFSFPDLNNETVSLEDERFQNKSIVILIFGSWCPNCKDETELYANLYKEYKNKGIEFVGIAFERSEELEKAKVTLDKYMAHFDIGYPILFGGKASKKVASQKFPMLNHIMSFPTTIVLNEKHEVVKIHTGFYGPATSKYNEFIADFTALLNELSGK